MKLFKQFLLVLALFFAALQLAFAVEVNSADTAALDSVKDIGPKTAAKIVEERSKNGPFKDWDDLITRVKGIGPKNSDTMSAAGLTVNGKAKSGVPAGKAEAEAKGDKHPVKSNKEKGKPEDEKPADGAKSDQASGGADEPKKGAHEKKPKKDKTRPGTGDKDDDKGGKKEATKTDKSSGAADESKDAAAGADAKKDTHKHKSKKEKDKEKLKPDDGGKAPANDDKASGTADDKKGKQ